MIHGLTRRRITYIYIYIYIYKRVSWFLFKETCFSCLVKQYCPLSTFPLTLKSYLPQLWCLCSCCITRGLSANELPEVWVCGWTDLVVCQGRVVLVGQSCLDERRQGLRPPLPHPGVRVLADLHTQTRWFTSEWCVWVFMLRRAQKSSDALKTKYNHCFILFFRLPAVIPPLLLPMRQSITV